MQERIDFCITLIGEKVLKSERKQAFRAKFGDFSANQIEAYIGRAKAIVRDRYKDAQSDHAGSALAFLESMVANRDESGMVRLKAQEQIIDLLGLAAPSKHEVATHEMTPEDRRAAIGRVFGIRTEEATVKE